MKKQGILFISMAAFFLSSISAFFITITDRQQQLWIATFLAVAFWSTLIVGIVFCVMLAKKIKPQDKAANRSLNFFKGKALVMIDTVLTASVVCMIIINICRINITLLWAALIFLAIFFIELHCLFSIKNQEGLK